jgi:hypothetical protein
MMIEGNTIFAVEVEKIGLEMAKEHQPLIMHDFLWGLNNLWPVRESRYPENLFLFIKVDSRKRLNFI